MILKKLPLLVCLLMSLLIFSQRPAADVVKTDIGNLTIQPILHGTLAFEFNQKVIYIDPYGGAAAFKGIPDPDLILITDIHGDHLNEGTLDALETKNVPIIVPQAVADKISDKYKGQLRILENGQSASLFEIGIKAIPMYNLPESNDAKHVKGRGNGYLLDFGGKIVYVSGDTAGIDEMRALKNIDIAFICMNLPYTMDVSEAASAVLDFKPSVVYPFHYRGKPDMSDTTVFKSLVNEKNQDIEVRLRDWYPVYE